LFDDSFIDSDPRQEHRPMTANDTVDLTTGGERYAHVRYERRIIFAAR
jgi:hypothetical protein